MILQLLRPLFIIWAFCMLLTAATELGSGQWIPNILSHAGVDGILVLVWINGLMAIGRQFAGTRRNEVSNGGTSANSFGAATPPSSNKRWPLGCTRLW